jgi:hypothetical protein
MTHVDQENMHTPGHLTAPAAATCAQLANIPLKACAVRLDASCALLVATETQNPGGLTIAITFAQLGGTGLVDQQMLIATEGVPLAGTLTMGGATARTVAEASTLTTGGTTARPAAKASFLTKDRPRARPAAEASTLMPDGELAPTVTPDNILALLHLRARTALPGRQISTRTQRQPAQLVMPVSFRMEVP